MPPQRRSQAPASRSNSAAQASSSRNDSIVQAPSSRKNSTPLPPINTALAIAADVVSTTLAPLLPENDTSLASKKQSAEPPTAAEKTIGINSDVNSILARKGKKRAASPPPTPPSQSASKKRRTNPPRAKKRTASNLISPLTSTQQSLTSPPTVSGPSTNPPSDPRTFPTNPAPLGPSPPPAHTHPQNINPLPPLPPLDPRIESALLTRRRNRLDAPSTVNDRASTISPTNNSAADAEALFGLPKPPNTAEPFDPEAFVYPDQDVVAAAAAEAEEPAPTAAECEARTPVYSAGEMAWVVASFGGEEGFLRSLGLRSGRAGDREEGRVVARAMICEEGREGMGGWV